MTDETAFRAHEAVQSEYGSRLIGKGNGCAVPFIQGNAFRDVIRHQLPGPAENFHCNQGLLRQNQMVHQFSAVVEGQSDSGSENAVGDAPVIGGGSVHSRNSDSVSELATIANWLRNRCDSLTRAWELAEGASDLSSVEGSIDSLLDASRDYGRLFSESYDSWAPAESDE